MIKKVSPPDYYESIDIIKEYLDLINENSIFNIQISEQEWKMFFNEVYNYLNSINRINDFYAVLYVTINRALLNYLHQRQNSVVSMELLIDSLNEIKFLNFKKDEIGGLKKILKEGKNGLLNNKTIYLTEFKRK